MSAANGHMRTEAGGQATRRAVAEAHAAQAERESKLAVQLGESVALHLAPLLAELVQRVAVQPECARCIARAKQQIRDYEIAVRNARQANEPVPDAPSAPEVARSVTWQDGQPVCFADFELADVTAQRA